jgi:hypothetical protein
MGAGLFPVFGPCRVRAGQAGTAASGSARGRGGGWTGRGLRRARSRIGVLVKQIGVEAVVPADQILADAAAKVNPADLGSLCDRIRDYVDPDGSEPMKRFEKRELTLLDVGGMGGDPGTVGSRGRRRSAGGGGRADDTAGAR